MVWVCGFIRGAILRRLLFINSSYATFKDIFAETILYLCSFVRFYFVLFLEGMLAILRDRVSCCPEDLKVTMWLRMTFTFFFVNHSCMYVCAFTCTHVHGIWACAPQHICGSEDSSVKSVLPLLCRWSWEL